MITTGSHEISFCLSRVSGVPRVPREVRAAQL